MRVKGASLSVLAESRKDEPTVYKLARIVASPFRFDVLGIENIQTSGPAIFLSNHLGAIGPLAVMLSVPIRFYPWIVTEMMDNQRSPQYLLDDFVSPVLHLHGKLGLAFSTLLTKFAIRLFRAIDAVSIDRFGGTTVEGFRQSLRLLRDCKNLLIFPENSLLARDEETLMRPFMPGFATLCHLYQHEQHHLLPIYPVAVHAESETVSIGKPEYYCALNHHREEIDKFTHLLELHVKELYLGQKYKPQEYA
jgi:1-acyl-sn-glycerol-3-phosphate acyltransferase